MRTIFRSVVFLLLGAIPGVAFAQADLDEPALPAEDAADVSEQPPAPPDAEAEEAPPPKAALPPADAPTQATFETQLSPYGRWVTDPEYGRVWLPNGVAADWQPYTDGSWVYTDWGWSFAPTVPWGATVFHYGRWGFGAGLGWYWVPGTVWAPAWVSWRHSNGFVSWAPYGPRGYRYGTAWHGWAAIPVRHLGHPIYSHLVPRPYLGATVRVGVRSPSIRVSPPRRGFYGPPRGGGHFGGGSHRH